MRPILTPSYAQSSGHAADDTVNRTGENGAVKGQIEKNGVPDEIRDDM